MTTTAISFVRLQVYNVLVLLSSFNILTVLNSATEGWCEETYEWAR